MVPYLGDLMKRALDSLNENFSIRVRELGINLIGSAANAVGSEIIPYFDTVLVPLQGYLTMQHTDDTQVGFSTLYMLHVLLCVFGCCNFNIRLSRCY